MPNPIIARRLTQQTPSIGEGTPETFAGCIANFSTDPATATYSGAVSWLAETTDTDGYHSTASNQDRITIPASANGKWGIFRATVDMRDVDTTGGVQIALLKGGSVAFAGHSGMVARNHSGASAPVYLCLTSPPVPLATGDIFTSFLGSNDSVVIQAVRSSFSLQVIG